MKKGIKTQYANFCKNIESLRTYGTSKWKLLKFKKFYDTFEMK